MSLINPLTGRKIKRGGYTHKKLLKALDTIDDVLYSQYGGDSTAESIDAAHEDFYEKLLSKSRAYDAPDPGSSLDMVNVPKSKYNRIASAMPPNPEQHSWYHHHAPFSQNFGDYVCLKRSTLKQMGMFLKDSLLANDT
jgi:hypothetical protein